MLDWDDARARSALRAIFDAAVGAADPARVLHRFLPEPPAPPGRVVVVGCGKAAPGMAAAVEAIARTADGEALLVEQFADAADQQHFVVLVITTVTSTFDRL